MRALGITALLVALAVWGLGDGAYRWAKALHIIAVISWMAGMLYLPRLFIYHCDAERGSPMSETFKVMEHRLLTIIINPAMIITWVLGLWLTWHTAAYETAWFAVKFALVLALSATHGFFSVAVRRFRDDQNTISARHWRLINEIPTVLMIGIVILVVVRPF